MVQHGVVAAVIISVLLMKPLPIVLCLRRRAPHHCFGPGSILDNWADVCGFLKPPGSQKFWKVSKHGAFSIPRQALGLRANNQSCHHETWLHFHFVDWSNQWNHQAHHNGNIRLKERPASSGKELQNAISAMFLATIRSHHDFATTCAPSFLRFPLLIITK